MSGPVDDLATAPKPNRQRGQASSTVPRSQIRKPLLEFLKAELRRQGSKRLKLTPGIKRRLIVLGDGLSSLRIQSWLDSQDDVADIPAFVEKFMKLLPQSISTGHAWLVRRSKHVPKDRPGFAEKLGKAVERSKPAEEPDSVLRTRNPRADKLSEGDGAITGSLPVGRIWRVWEDLLRSPQKQGRLRLSEPVWKVIQSIPRDALVPASAKGKKSASDFGDARDIARQLALEMLRAQKGGPTRIRLKLGDAYQRVKKLEERKPIFDTLKDIWKRLRAAMPKNATRLRSIDVTFEGKKIVRQLTL